LPTGNSFYLAASRYSPKTFYFGDVEIDNITFPTLIPISEPNTFECVKAKLANGKLELRGGEFSHYIEYPQFRKKLPEMLLTKVSYNCGTKLFFNIIYTILYEKSQKN